MSLSWKSWQRLLGGHFICIDLRLLAAKLRKQLSTDELRNVVSIGNSGYNFARRIAPDCVNMPVETITFARERELRELRVEPLELDGPPVLVDDVAVSGLTLAVTNKNLRPAAQTVGVGMLYNSRTTRRVINVGDLRSGFVYSREQGGRPPVNSLDSLRAFPDRCEALARQYFSDGQAAFCNLVANPGVTE